MLPLESLISPGTNKYFHIPMRFFSGILGQIRDCWHQTVISPILPQEEGTYGRYMGNK